MAKSFAPGLNETAIRATGCGVQVRNCVFNEFTRAVEIVDGYGDFLACTFTNNYDPIAGGAVYVGAAQACPPTTFAECKFIGNSADSRGGAIYLTSTGSYNPAAPQVSFVRCTFDGNDAPEGAAVRIGHNRNPTFSECLFMRNTTSSGSLGSVVSGVGGVGATFTNCTFADNVGPDLFSVLYLEPLSGGSAVSVDACVFARNTNGTAFSAVHGLEYDISRSNFFGNASGDASWVAQGTECIGEDPAFCNDSDYTVYSFSPCAAGVVFPSLVGAGPVGCSPNAAIELVAGVGQVLPDTLLFGCPGGDADSFAVRIDFDDSVLTRELGAEELRLALPYSTNGTWSPSPIVADTPVLGPDFGTTLGYRYISGTGVDSVEIQLNGYPLAMKPVLQRRGPDLDGDGEVDVQDLAIFGTDYQSPPKPYNARSDFDGSGTVVVGDFSTFGAHVNHKHPFVSETLTPAAVHASSASIVLRFEEIDPLLGEHRMRAHLTMMDAELFKAVLIAVGNDNPLFEFAGWHPNPSYSQVTMGTRTNWNGRTVVMIGALGSKDRRTPYVDLGYFDLVVHSDDPVEPSPQDFAILSSEMLEVNGSVLNVPASSAQRTYTAPVYRTALGQNFPNPFNPTTTIVFSLEKKVRTSLVVYDVTGSRVRTLLDGQRDRGNHRVVWDGQNDRGNPVSSGVYFYRLTAGSFRSAKKMVLLK